MTNDNPLANTACCSTCASAEGPDLPQSCTLPPDGLEPRLARIRDLAARHLLRSEREGLSLRLTYRAEAKGEIRALMTREAECCGFLSFAIEAGDQTTVLRLSSPEHARIAAERLFDAFEGRAEVAR